MQIRDFSMQAVISLTLVDDSFIHSDPGDVSYTLNWIDMIATVSSWSFAKYTFVSGLVMCYVSNWNIKRFKIRSWHWALLCFNWAF